MTLETGSFVRLRGTDERGQVYHTYGASDGCPDDDSWLKQQRWLEPQPMRFVNDQWFAVLIHQDDTMMNGSITAPASKLEEIEPFKINHPWESFYVPSQYRYANIVARRRREAEALAHQERLNHSIRTATAAVRELNAVMKDKEGVYKSDVMW